MNPSGMPFWKISPCSMMGVWCFCFGMGRRLKCEKSSSPVGEIRQGCFFVMIQVHNCKILAHSETFQHLGNNPTRLLFHSFSLSKTHLILLSPIDTPQKTPPIVCFLKKRRAIVCTLAHESKKIMHPIFGVHDFYIVSSKIRLWWRRRELNSCPKTNPHNFLRA